MRVGDVAHGIGDDEGPALLVAAALAHWLEDLYQEQDHTPLRPHVDRQGMSSGLAD